MVFLTFDDAVSIDNFPFYQEVLFNRKNPNGQPITATFFITHEYTNYSMVHELWRNGHEIGLHSISHRSDVSYWKNLNATMWRQEIVDQREQLSQFARVPAAEVKGIRAPFLQPGGDTMYEVLSQARFQYDCSRPTLNYRAPGLWPYTNDYLSSQDCQIDPCPVGRYPNFWTVPMIDMKGENGEGCAMVDTCTPYPTTPNETFQLMNRNFLDHYNGNRAPFGVFAHSAWMNGTEDEFIWERRNGYIQFLDYLATLPDVYIVSISRALEWVKNPTPTANITDFEPFKVTVRPTSCPSTNRCHYRAEQTPFPTERLIRKNNYNILQ